MLTDRSSDKADGSLRINFWGDISLQHPISRCTHPDFVCLRDVLAQGGLNFANLECTLQDGEDWPAFIAGQGGFGSPYLGIGPWLANELRELGFKTVFTANNHSSDFGEGGILTTIGYLDRAGIHHAGTGTNLSEATAPTYVTTPIGRVAFLAAADNGIRYRGGTPVPIPRGCVAADQGPWYPDRPGVNMVRYEPTFYVDRMTLDALRRASSLLGWEEEKQLRTRGSGLMIPSVGASATEDRRDRDDLFHFQGSRFALGDEFSLTTACVAMDLERNCRWIDDARRNAELVVVGFHQNGTVWSEGQRDYPPADHTHEFAHRAIDAGADIFVVHGVGNGAVEFYNGKVIIYGTSGLNQLYARTKIPAEQLLRLGLPPDATPSDVNDMMKSDQLGSFASGRSGISRPGGRELLHTVIVGEDGAITQVLARPLKFHRGGWAGAGTPTLAFADDPLHNEVLQDLTRRCEAVGTRLRRIDELAILEPE